VVLGTCIVRGPGAAIHELVPVSISITGQQDGFVVGFVVRQRFKHGAPAPQDLSYIVPNNSKICMDDTTLRIGSEVIKAVLEEKKRAEEIFDEAKSAGPAAVLGSGLGDGLVEFKLGNVPGGELCEVGVKCGVTATSSGPSSIFFKLPLDACTPSGSTRSICSRLNGSFEFWLENCDPGSVSKIESNVESGTYSNGRYEVNAIPTVQSIIVKTELLHQLNSKCIVRGNMMAVTFYASQFSSTQIWNNEFVFVVDCSGSMSGERIRRARDCLHIFIRSLPPNSFFNVIRFGSAFESLFDRSSP
jgi:hypothetical protein